MYTNEELLKMIMKCKFPKDMHVSKRVEIRDLVLEGKEESAFAKLRKILVPNDNLREKTLL